MIKESKRDVMMAKLSAQFLVPCALVLALCSCDGIDGLTRFNSEKFTKDAQEQTQENIENIQSGKDSRAANDVFKVTNDVWVGNQTMRLTRGKPLPRDFDGPHGIILSMSEAADLPAITSKITEITKIPVRIDDTAVAGGGDTGPAPLMLSYDGSFSGLLDQICAHFNLSWSYDGSSVSLYHFETRTFTVESLPGSITLSDEFKGDDSGGSSGGGSQDSVKQENTSTIDIGYWDELSSALDALIGDTGKVAISQSIGSITVTTTPQKMRQVAAFMNDQNMRLSRQVAINVEVLSITLTNSDSYGSDLSNVFGSAANRVGADPTGIYKITGPGAGIVPNFPVSDAGQISVSLLGKDWSLSAIIRALSRLGNVTTVARAPMTTLNNRAASRKITTDKAYVASITSNVAGSTGTTSTSITPATVSDGLTLQILPRILDDGRILIQYSLKISTLQSITSFSTAAEASTVPNTVQTPEVQNKAFLQQAIMQSGSTLVLAGFDQDKRTGDTAGIGSAYNWFLGGGVVNAREKQMLVIAITPREVTPSRGVSPL